MQRFFVPSQNISSGKIRILDSRQAHYIRDVLCLKINEQVNVFDEKGRGYSCFISGLSPELTLNIKDTIQPLKVRETPSLTVACAIPKKSKMDDIIDKLTQLGVDRIIPLKTKRVIVSLDERKGQLRLIRWQKIAQGSSEQCQRNTLPVIEPIKGIKEVLLEEAVYDLKLILALSGRRRTLIEILQNTKPSSILVLIGPEGDFTDEEIDLAKQSGFIPVSLGNLVLRVETAAVAVASFIRLLSM